jgi:cathepsin L
MSHHGRDYVVGSEEYKNRFALFQQSLDAVDTHNKKVNRWIAAVNKFADWSEEELSKLNGWRGDVHRSMKSRGHVQFRSLSKFQRHHTPASMSWQHLKAVQDIQDQGQCGSCWAISTATVLRSHAEIHTGSNRTFSTQELVSCITNPRNCGGTGGCDGATAELAFAYTMRFGLATNSEFAYRGVDKACPALARERITEWLGSGDIEEQGSWDLEQAMEGISSASQHESGVHDLGRSFGMHAWQRLPENDGKSLMEALVRGPVVVTVSATPWFRYQSGIFDTCPKDSIVDHAVALIGYGVEGNTNYWLILNSWGKSWGERGTVRLLRHHNMEEEPCGIDTKPSEGTTCDGGPDSVEVCGECGLFYDSTLPIFSAQ